MSDNNVHQVFQLCSFLLSYPNQEFVDSLEEIEADLESIPSLEMKDELEQFYQKAKKLSPSQLITTYVQTFDFGKKTNLYVTYMSNGEQRERGMDLLFLKNYYKMHGFAVSDKELPDYLPVMLEFAGCVGPEELTPVFDRYLKNIKEIERHLVEEENLYRHIFQAILLALEELGITTAVRRSEEICLNNFYG